ncbi:MAG TPA: isochorismatase family protein [Candidatus Sulfotelmatobacter sp.]|nr:isochorismatase family protein [Candidatus Sulfotelmatobacter sp.]
MPLSALDRTPALVVIDLQKGIVSYPTVHPIEPVVHNAAELARAFRRRGWPVVLVNVTAVPSGRTQAQRLSAAPAPDWAELVPELDAQPKDVLVTKRSWGAFHGTALDAELRKLGATQIVLAGVATSIGVESTAREAYAHGYHVVLATDAMTDLNPDAHANSVERIFPRLGETATTAELLGAIDRAG